MAEKLLFDTNTPVTVALKFARGKEVESSYSDQAQWMYSTTDGRVFFASAALDEKICALDAPARTPIRITKKEVRNGGGKPYCEWSVCLESYAQEEGQSASKLSIPPQAVQAAPVPQNGKLTSASKVPTQLPIDQAMTLCLLTAGRATREAEQILGAEGGSVRFDSRDVAALATTMLIHATREGFVTWIAPEPAPATKPAASAPTNGVPWFTRGEMKRAFSDLRGQLGEPRYMAELARCSVASPDGFKTGEAAEACYRRMVALLQEVA